MTSMPLYIGVPPPVQRVNGTPKRAVTLTVWLLRAAVMRRGEARSGVWAVLCLALCSEPAGADPWI